MLQCLKFASISLDGRAILKGKYLEHQKFQYLYLSYQNSSISSLVNLTSPKLKFKIVFFLPFDNETSFLPFELKTREVDVKTIKWSSPFIEFKE